jgi:cholesterol transport system auxiliary component
MMSPASPILASHAFRRALFVVATALLVATLLAACSISRPYATKRMFLLEPTPPTAPAAAGTPRPASVRVGIVNVAAPFRGKTFVYRESDLRYEADYYDEFFVAPAIMVSDATAKALAASNVFRRVVPFGAASDEGEYALDGFVSELYADTRDPAAPAAVVTVQYYLTPVNAVNPGVIWTREYRQRAKVSGTGPEAMARGWNEALTALLAQLVRDLAVAELPK